MFDYLIIGAGVTGITIGRLLQQKGNNRFLILEKEPEPGGLCRTKKIKGHILDIGGGHFLCSIYPEVYKFIFSHLPKENFNYYERVSKIQLGNMTIDYPIESNLWQLPLDTQVEYLISAIQSGEVTGKKEPENYNQWIRWKLGNAIAENYMIPYNQKIWGVKPERMDIDWLHKIPCLDSKEILRSCLVRQSDRKKFPSHAGFYYPKKGGFQSIFDSIHKHLQKYVHLNEAVTKLEYQKNHWLINNNYRAKKIINTAPWSCIYKALGKPKAISQPIKLLKANTIVVSLWEEPYNHDWHWLYIPDFKKERHREFFINNFCPASKKGGFFSETNIARWPGPNNQWSNNKKPIFEFINEYSYPIAIIGHSQAISNILNYFEQMHLYGVGRWGQWRYMNMDVCMWQAMQLLKRIS